jgi:hypothetical protein
MRNRWIITGLLVATGLLTGPAADHARAQPTAWDVSGNSEFPVWAPIGTYQHDGSGWYTGVEFVIMNQPRAIGHQRVAVRGVVDTAGFLTGTPGTFLGSGVEALNTNQFGRTGWSPGQRLTFGYRMENGWSFSISWLHLYDTKYSGGAGQQSPDFTNPGFNLENTVLFAPVFNFAPEFVGPEARNTNSIGEIVFGDLLGIWNGAHDMSMLFSQRFDNWDVTGRFPVFETENSRSYAMAGGRFSWFWERFQWRTVALGLQVEGIDEGDPPIMVSQPDWAARYMNTLSQRMYGPFIGSGHEVMLYSGHGGAVGFGVECTGAILVNIIKERAKYIREDEATQAKRSWTENKITPNVNIEFNLTWQPVDGLTFKAGWSALNYFNTLYMESPIGFNYGAMDPAYEKRFWRCVHGCNFGVGYVW